MHPKILVLVGGLLAAAGCARATAQVVATACGAECGGCCDQAGRCLEGNLESACGLDGVACLQCDGASACFDGRCQGAGGGGGTGGSGGGAAGGGAGGGGEVDAGVLACPPDGWCVESPAADGSRLTNQHLRGVFAVSAADVWAVGDRGTALHFDGQAWAQTDTQAIDDLFAVWAAGPADVWAVGGSGWPTGPVGVVFHWNGTAWSEVKRGMQRLEALWGSAANDIWAVGYGGEMQHYDGISWTQKPQVTTESITAIHGVSSGRAWAVGSSGLVLDWNGTQWTSVPNNMFSGLAAVFAFRADQVWAMGGNGAALRYDGTGWQTVDLGTDNTVLGFWGTSPGEAWGVGPDTLLRFGPAGRSRKASPTTDLLLDVHGSDANNIWAVGFKGTVLRYRR